MNRKKPNLRDLHRRGRKEYLTVGAVVASTIIGLFGVAVLALGAYLLFGSLAYLVDGGDPFVTVGAARPTPLWWAMIGAVVAILGGGWLISLCGGYLYRCATGKVIRLSPDELKRHRERLAERERRMRAGH